MSPDAVALFRPASVEVCSSVPQMPLIVILAQSWPVLAIIVLAIALIVCTAIRAAWPNKAQQVADDAPRVHEILEIRARRAGL